MTGRIKAVLTGGLAALATVFGALQSGTLPFSPDKGLDVTVTWRAGERQVLFERDGGNMNCVIRFRPPQSSTMPEARTTMDHRLDVSRSPSDPNWVCVSEPTRSLERPVKFLWPGGESIIVASIAGPVTEWRIDQEKGPNDSSGKQHRRRIWLWWVTIPSVLITAIAAVIAVVLKEEPPKPPPVGADRVIELIISSIEGASPAETGTMQRYVRSALLGGETSAAVLLRTALERRLGLQALRIFRTTLDTMIAELDQKRARLKLR